MAERAADHLKTAFQAMLRSGINDPSLFEAKFKDSHGTGLTLATVIGRWAEADGIKLLAICLNLAVARSENEPDEAPLLAAAILQLAEKRQRTSRRQHQIDDLTAHALTEMGGPGTAPLIRLLERQHCSPAQRGAAVGQLLSTGKTSIESAANILFKNHLKNNRDREKCAQAFSGKFRKYKSLKIIADGLRDLILSEEEDKPEDIFIKFLIVVPKSPLIISRYVDKRGITYRLLNFDHTLRLQKFPTSPEIIFPNYNGGDRNFRIFEERLERALKSTEPRFKTLWRTASSAKKGA